MCGCSPSTISIPFSSIRRVAWRVSIVRASNEGSPRPRVARAQKSAWPFLLYPSQLLSRISFLEGHPCWSTCGRRTRPFLGRAFREHRTNVGVLPLLFIVRVLRARRAPGRSPPSLILELTGNRAIPTPILIRPISTHL